ncbi:MAG: T9SS type A sorting domain-containing protein [Bacteroidota bacterium]
MGSSYSDDGGLNWTTIETTAQRTALGIADADHMWAGGFTTSSTSDGIFKYQIIPTVTCTTPGISAGTSVTASAVQLCGGDTAVFTSSGVFAPTVGAYAGVSWVITSADISGSSSPLTEPSLVASYTFSFPAPATSLRQFVNNGTLINGTNIPYGTYYWTPVVFGNAIAATNPPTFLSDLQLDPTCTLTGTSVAVAVLDPADPQCSGTGLAEVNASLPIRTRIVAEQLELRFESNNGGIALLDVYDLSGRLVLTRNAATSAGENTILLDASAFSSGTYVVKVALNGFAGQAKVVKM